MLLEYGQRQVLLLPMSLLLAVKLNKSLFKAYLQVFKVLASQLR